MTVLFADVAHSMGIAAAVGAERLREIMAELLDRSTAVVQRYGGTVDKFSVVIEKTPLDGTDLLAPSGPRYL